MKAHNNNLDIKINTLLDTGNPTSFVKRKFVSDKILPETKNDNSKFYGINKTKLNLLRKIFVTIKLNEIVRENILLYVVPNDIMSSSMILSRDALKQFNLKLVVISKKYCTWSQ